MILIGRLGPEALAAGALATNLYFALAFLGIGLVSATAPLLAETLGRRPNAVREVRRTVRQGLWSALAMSVPVWVVLWNGEQVLLALGQEPALAAAAGPYLRTLMWGLAPYLGFGVLRFFLSALGRPGWGLAIGVAAIPVNVLLAYGLIHGIGGLPRLGLPGAGIATSLTSLAMFVALAGVFATDRRLRRYHVLGRWWRADAPRFRRLWRLGLPIAATLAFEVGVFNAAALAMGVLGTVPLAAHAVAIQIAATVFMIPLGLAQAATVRVGLAYGAGDRERVRVAGRVAIAVVVGFMTVTASILSLLPATLAAIFVDETRAANAGVLDLAVTLLLLAAVFQMADGLQAVGSGLLRGVQDTRVPMIYAALGYWGIGASLGLALAFGLGWGAPGIWIGLATGLAVVAALMLDRWRRRERLGLLGPRTAAV